MWSRFWNISKRITPLIAKFTFLYPLILLLRAILFKSTGRGMDFLISLFLVLSGYFFTGLITRKKMTPKRMFISYSLATLLMIAYAGAYFYRDSSLLGVLRAFFEGLAAFVLFFTGIRSRVLDFQIVLDKKTITIGVLIFLASIIFLDYYKELTHLRGNIYLMGYIFAVIVLLVRNQQGLDRAFIQKHIDFSTIPKNIRNYNSLIIISLFILILVLFNVNFLIGFIMIAIKNTPKYILMAIFYIFYFLSRLFPGGNNGGEEGAGEVQSPMLPGENSNSIVGLVLTIIFALISLVVIIYLSPKIPKLLGAIGRKIKNTFLLILNFIKRFFKLYKENDENNLDYIDRTEVIRPERSSKKFKNPKEIFRAINRRLRRNITPAEEVRNMYALILCSLKRKGIKISKSDTPYEIYNKISEIENLDETMKFITTVYEKVRYGGKVPTKEELDSYQDYARQTIHILDI